MKKITLAFSAILLSTIPISAQLNHLHNMIRPGDEIVKLRIEHLDSGKSGKNQLWDFTKIYPVENEYTLTYSMSESENINPENVIIGSEHYTNYYYQYRNDSLFKFRHENANTRLHYSKPMLIIKYPLDYGDVLLSGYIGQGLYSGEDSLYTRGTVRIEADAYGKMLLPTKDTLNHVLRVKTTQTIMVQVEEGDPTEFVFDRIMESYQWFSKGYRYPIFETIRSIHLKDSIEVYNTSFYYPPQEHFYLDTDPENIALLDSLWYEKIKEEIIPPADAGLTGEITYSCYPNPVENELHLEFQSRESSIVTILINSSDGKAILNRKKNALTGELCKETIDCSKLVPGYYIMTLVTPSQIITEKFIKK